MAVGLMEETAFRSARVKLRLKKFRLVGEMKINRRARSILSATQNDRTIDCLAACLLRLDEGVEEESQTGR